MADNQYTETRLGQVLIHPDRRLPASQIPQLEEELIALATEKEFPIEPEYWKSATQYDSMIHAYENGKRPHIVLRGRNLFNFPIYRRTGDGRLELIKPGESFATHALVDINS